MAKQTDWTPKPSEPPSEAESTVFIIQRPRPKREDGWTPDFSAALQYGKLEFVFDMDDRVWADPKAAEEKAKQKLANFDAEKDFILWPGFCDPAALILVVMVLALGGNRMIRKLYWTKRTHGDQKSGYYIPVEFNMRHDRIRIG